MRKLGFLFRQTEQWLGENNEKRVIAAYKNDYPYPNRIPWLIDVRKATSEEDARGIDVVFTTDVGVINLQVKSSERGREEFVYEQVDGKRDSNIVPVAMSPAFDARAIVKIVTPLLAAERKMRQREALAKLEKVVYPEQED